MAHGNLKIHSQDVILATTTTTTAALRKENNVTMVVFRGIKTFEYIGQFLMGFGLEFSKIR